ncbi:MAG: hypothetical protein EA349_15505 [Halomonadaceae bacterium]|nr:MAG: hypothetical protein EA349_15505 [Halomonadaceae bacterium]
MFRFFESFQSITCSLLTIVTLPACYAPEGLVPEERKPREQVLWTREQVDQVVDVSFVTIDGGEPTGNPAVPEACDKVSFLRFRHHQGPEDAAEADAAFLMVPGVLEGANGFDYMGRQMVYMAAKEHGKNIEVWAMDRRSNCLEDLTGLHAAAGADTADEARDIILDYYYRNGVIDGRLFAGFKTSSELPFLAEFGLRQTTLDMQAILEHMIPSVETRREKVFVGGHSLGGLHTSVYMSWNFAEDPDDLEGAGYNQVAGAFGLDTIVAPLDSLAFFDEAEETTASAMSDSQFASLARNRESNDFSYRFNLRLLRAGIIPRNLQIPGIMTSEVIALPEMMGIVAAKAPDDEATLYQEMPKSAAVRNTFNINHSKDPRSIGAAPTMEKFRYTNKAFIGLMFDNNFQRQSFLQAGLGFMDGGPMMRKWESQDDTDSQGGNKLYIAGDAGPDHKRFGQGPLYGWASRDQIGTPENPDFTDVDGKTVFTTLENEPVNMDDFIHSLQNGPTNLTEWYFPLRILLDIPAAIQPYGPDHGLMTYHPEGPGKVPSILLNGADGISFGDQLELPLQTRIIAPGYSHMDPMFEAVNSPSQTSYVMRPLLEFAFMVMETQQP